MKMKRIVVVLAHPDDETFICGGTIARYASEGHRVTLVCATKGEQGRRLGIPPVATRESLPLLREVELKEACQSLGISRLVLLGLRDKTLEIQPEGALAGRVLTWLRTEDADEVLTFHEKLGGHPDHNAIGAAATAAFLVWQGEKPSARLHFITWEHIAQRHAQYGFHKTQVGRIEITAHARAKLLAYRAHRTQSGLNDWVWRNEKEGISRLTGVEYLLHHGRD